MTNPPEEPQVDIALLKATFTTADDTIRPEIACLVSIIKYYGKSYSVDQLTEWANIDNKKFITLNGLKHAAIQAGFKAEIKLLTMEQLQKLRLPRILFFEDQLGVIGYVVCYGMHGPRFVIGEPTFTFMQYFPRQMEKMWIKGITLDLFPNDAFAY